MIKLVIIIYQLIIINSLISQIAKSVQIKRSIIPVPEKHLRNTILFLYSNNIRFSE